MPETPDDETETETVHVDLTPDDEAAVDDHDHDHTMPADSPDDPSTPGPSASQEALAEQAQEVAQDHLKHADGASDAEKVQNAFETLAQKHTQFAEQHQQIVQDHRNIQRQREQFKETRAHLQAIADDPDDDRLVMRDWAAGISTEIRDMEEVIALLGERLDQHDDTLTEIAEQAAEIEQNKQIAAGACQHLQSAKDTLSGLMGDGPGVARNGEQTPSTSPSLSPDDTAL